MRFAVYSIAVLAAAAIVYFVGTTRPDAVASIQLISLKVPTMHCPAGCYPSVKKTLEGKAGVQQVELAEQKEEGLIDNPVVLIKATPDFDLEKAVAALEQDGFGGAEVVP